MVIHDRETTNSHCKDSSKFLEPVLQPLHQSKSQESSRARSAARRSSATAAGSAEVVQEQPFDAQAKYAEACELASRGQHEEARRLYAPLERLPTSADGEGRLRALVQNDLAVMAAMDGRFDEARAGWQAALEIDRDCLVARLNRDHESRTSTQRPIGQPISPSRRTQSLQELDLSGVVDVVHCNAL